MEWLGEAIYHWYARLSPNHDHDISLEKKIVLFVFQFFF